MREEKLLSYLKGACTGRRYSASSAALEAAIGISMSQRAGSEYEEIIITNYDPRKACWQLSLENLLGGDGDTRYEMIHEPKCPLKC